MSDWLEHGFERQTPAVIGALIAAWTGLPFALFIAIAGMFVGAVVGVFGISVTALKLGPLGSVLNSIGGGLIGAILGAAVGLVGC